MHTEEARACFLGVERSLSGRRWESRLSAGAERQVLFLTQRLGVPDLIGRILAGRGVSVDDAASFLAPSLRHALPDPSSFIDLDRATTAVADALERGEDIGVLGDYDVDGATSAAVLVRYFRAINKTLCVHIPDRITEGYGPNQQALDNLKARGCRLVFTVDCGTVAYELLDRVQEAGLSIIVLDHHVGEPRLPAVTAVVNPNRQDETGRYGELCACGVVFLFLVGLNRELRRRDFFRIQGMSEPDLIGCLDLVALGTVADVMPLKGLNRAYVAQGLKVMARRQNAGLVALCDVAGLSTAPQSSHLAFSLAPRINAGGRVGDASLGLRLLTCDDPTEASLLARRLDQMNAERKELEDSVLLSASRQAQHQSDCLIVTGQGWHPGVIGIVASRLKDRFHAPTVVISFDEQGRGKGSGRSVAGVDLGAAVTAARQAGLLCTGGGHAMAAGLSMTEDTLDDFIAFMRARVVCDLVPRVPVLGIDGALTPAAACGDLVDLLDSCGPYGVGNVQPRFVLPSMQIVKPVVRQDKHVSCLLRGQDGLSLKAIAFRVMGTELGQGLLNSHGGVFHVAGKLQRDSYGYRDAVQIIIEDASLIF